MATQRFGELEKKIVKTNAVINSPPLCRERIQLGLWFWLRFIVELMIRSYQYDTSTLTNSLTLVDKVDSFQCAG
jgi:hypothetical protein